MKFTLKKRYIPVIQKLYFAIEILSLENCNDIADLKGVMGEESRERFGVV
jgi:hypothetical protein